ncbi:polysaccharide deacetylase family protein [Arthrobacter pigmenti]
MVTAKAVLAAASVVAALILTTALVVGAPSQEEKARAGTAGPALEQERPGPSSNGLSKGTAEPVIWDTRVESTPLDNPRTVVSLTFDDAFAGQYKAAEILSRYGIEGTFFTPSGSIGQDDYLSLDQLWTIAANGHEIGGHTVDHSDLVQSSVDEAMRQVCLDRKNLTEWGFAVTSFAYPYASMNEEVQRVSEECGYNSARGLGDLATKNHCIGCPGAESIPPRNPYLTRAPEMVTSAWTFADLRQVVQQAEETGGWTQLTFHHVCDSGCSELAITPKLLEQFAAWLVDRSTVGTATRTVHQVVGGPVQPPVDAPADPAPSAGINGIRNPSVEVAGDKLPRCWQASHWGDISPRFQTTAPGRNGNTALKLVVDKAVAGAAQFIPSLDLGDCAPGATPGHSYSLRAWYTATAQTQFSVYLRNSSGEWEYWTSSGFFDPAKNYTQAAWTTPPLPEDVTGLSFGLSLGEPGELITDDYAMYDKRGAPAVAQRGTS